MKGMTMEFRPTEFLKNESSSCGAPRPALLILNAPIASFDVVKRLWQQTDYRICADGGANRLYDLLSGSLENHRAHFVCPQSVSSIGYLKNIIRAVNSNRITLTKLLRGRQRTDLTYQPAPAPHSHPRRPRLPLSDRPHLLRCACRPHHPRPRPKQHRFRQSAPKNLCAFPCSIRHPGPRQPRRPRRPRPRPAP